MKSLGIVLMAVMAGLVAASFGLAAGDGLWAALLNYLLAGMSVTATLAGLVLWRAWAAERHAARGVARPGLAAHVAK